MSSRHISPSSYVTVCRILFALCIFALGFASGWILTRTIGPSGKGLTEKGLRVNGQYKLVAPLLLCSSTQVGNVEPYLDLEKKITAQIASAKKMNNIMNVSVYFRDFKGNWLDINGTEQYAPASLLKVPIMIAYFKASESHPEVLTQKLRYDGLVNENDAETFATSSDLSVGSYTVNQLIRAMIVSSDNNAATLLYNNMNKEWLSEVYSDLGLTLKPGGSANTQNVTAKQYSYFFRILYNATYLTPADSEKALELLTQANFPPGIESTVPKDVLVANKFGERTLVTPTGTVIEHELHDCGIVYSAKGPYLVCIMTRGKDFDSLINVIDAVSSTVYNTFTSN